MISTTTTTTNDWRQQVLNRCRCVDRPVVVLDLDGTLLDVRARHAAIAHAWAEEAPAPMLPLLLGLRPEDFGYSVVGPLRRLGVEDEGALSALAAFWKLRFFHDDWMIHDRAAPGAVAFVLRLRAAGALIVYLTARTVQEQLRGTVDSLAKLGFPVADGNSILHMKPSKGLTDSRFKRAATGSVDRLGVVVAAFDNEPGHVNTFQAAWPDALNFLVGHRHSAGAPKPHPAILAIPDFSAGPV
jgi:hypothetical protein